MPNNKKLKPGKPVPETAIYVIYDKSGRNIGSMYLERGKNFPATPNSGSYYVKSE